MASILFIEDDTLVARMYKKILKFEGLEVDVAANGKEGLEKAKLTKPKLIFLDIMMPQMNGLEVLRHLKADPELKHIPVIMLTNLSGTQDAQKALKMGATAYMVKSEYRPKDVAQKAKEVLAGKVSTPVSTTQAQAASQPAQEQPKQEQGKPTSN